MALFSSHVVISSIRPGITAIVVLVGKRWLYLKLLFIITYFPHYALKK
jgi:hypothetical protein